MKLSKIQYASKADKHCEYILSKQLLIEKKVEKTTQTISLKAPFVTSKYARGLEQIQKAECSREGNCELNVNEMEQGKRLTLMQDLQLSYFLLCKCESLYTIGPQPLKPLLLFSSSRKVKYLQVSTSCLCIHTKKLYSVSLRRLS